MSVGHIFGKIRKLILRLARQQNFGHSSTERTALLANTIAGILS
jgi:hypothetical protein